LLRFHTPLIEPGMQISRTRLSDKTSRLRPRLVTPPRCQTHEPEVPVEVREWIGPAPASSDLVLVAQPPLPPAYQFDWRHEIVLIDDATVKVIRKRTRGSATVACCSCGLTRKGVPAFGTALAHEASERLALLSSVDIPLIYN